MVTKIPIIIVVGDERLSSKLIGHLIKIGLNPQRPAEPLATLIDNAIIKQTKIDAVSKKPR